LPADRRALMTTYDGADERLSGTELAALYTGRFTAERLRVKRTLWEPLCGDFFDRYVRPSDTVLDLCAGSVVVIVPAPAARSLLMPARRGGPLVGPPVEGPDRGGQCAPVRGQLVAVVRPPPQQRRGRQLPQPLVQHAAGHAVAPLAQVPGAHRAA